MHGRWEAIAIATTAESVWIRTVFICYGFWTPQLLLSFPTLTDKQWLLVFMGHKEDCGIIKSSCFKNLWSFYCSSEPAINLQNASLLGGPWKHKDKHDPHEGWRDLRCKYRNTTEKPNGIQNSSSPKPADPVLGRGHHWVTSQFREMCVAHLDCPRQSHFSRELLKPELKLQWRIMLFFWQQSRERGV